MYDVIVAGAGPSGSYTARRLAEKGYKVLVTDFKPGAGHKNSCTGIVGQEFTERYKIPSKLILRQDNSAMVFSPGGNTLHLYRKETQACILDRPAFDIYMAEKAQGAGAEYEFNCRVTGIAAGKDKSNVRVIRNERESSIPAKAVVLACGYNSGLNERAGLNGFKDYVTGAQTEVKAAGLEEVEVYFGDMAPGFFAWLVPTANGMARAGLLTRKDPGGFLKSWLKSLQKAGRISSGDTEIHYGAIPLKPPARTYGERLLAVGDAAGHTKPTSGGGIYYGIIGAECAAEILDKALGDGDLSAERLSSYQKAWGRKLGGELRKGYWARRLYERLSNEQVDLIFKMMKSTGIDKALLNADDLSFDWHSRTIMRLLKYQVVAGTLKIIRLPFGGGVPKTD